MHARALGGLRERLALAVQVADGVALLLGAGGGDHGAIGKRHGHPVVRGTGIHAVGVGVLVRDLFGIDHGGLAGTVGEHGGLSVVGDDVAGLVGVEVRVGELRLGGEVVVVVAVWLGHQAGVESEEFVTAGDHDVAVIARVVKA